MCFGACSEGKKESTQMAAALPPAQNAIPQPAQKGNRSWQPDQNLLFILNGSPKLGELAEHRAVHRNHGMLHFPLAAGIILAAPP